MTQLFLTLIFTALFAIQTTIFTYLLLKLKKSIERPRIAVENRYGPEEISESALRILRELSSSGPLGVREISRRLGLSREHTSRTLKRMVEDGLLIREGKPYRYKITDLGSELLRSRDVAG